MSMDSSYYEENFVKFFDTKMLIKNIENKHVYSQKDAFHKLFKNYCDAVEPKLNCEYSASLDLQSILNELFSDDEISSLEKKNEI